MDFINGMQVPPAGSEAEPQPPTIFAAFWTEMEASGAMILCSVMDFINGM